MYNKGEVATSLGRDDRICLNTPMNVTNMQGCVHQRVFSLTNKMWTTEALKHYNETCFQKQLKTIKFVAVKTNNKQSTVATPSWQMAAQMPLKSSLAIASDMRIASLVRRLLTAATSRGHRFTVALTQDIKHASRSARLSDCNAKLDSTWMHSGSGVRMHGGRGVYCWLSLILMLVKKSIVWWCRIVHSILI